MGWKYRRLTTTLCVLTVVAGCDLAATPVPITEVDATARVVEAGRLHVDGGAVGPVVQFGAGEAAGTPFQFTAFDTVSTRCVGMESFGSLSAAAGCTHDELPDDDFFTRLVGGGTCEAVNPEAGLIPRDAHAMWIDFEGGDRFPATVVDLEPMLDGAAYFFFLPQGVQPLALVATDAGGELVRRLELDRSPGCR